MAVSIPINADASQAVHAFDEMSAAINRAGQAGKSFKDIDFSHPELQGLEDSIRKVEQNFRDLKRVGQGPTAASVRKGQYRDAFEWYDGHQQQFTTPADLARHRALVGNYVLRGSAWGPGGNRRKDPPENPEPPKPEPSEGGGGGGGSGGGLAGTFLSGLKGAAGFTLGLAGIQGAASLAGRAFSQGSDEDIKNDSLMRRLDDAGDSFEQLRGQVRDLATAMHTTISDAQDLSIEWSRITGQSKAIDVLPGVQAAGQFARGFGLDPREVVPTFARAQALGEDPKRLAALIAEAVQKGGNNGQVEQVLGAVNRWMETASKQLIDHTNVAGFLDMYSQLNASREGGLRGDNAEQLIGQISSTLAQGGGAGPAGQALIGGEYMRHGVTDPYEMQYDMEEGAFGRVGPRTQRDAQGHLVASDNAPTLLQTVLEGIQRRYTGQNYYRTLEAGGRQLGITGHQFEAIRDHYSGSNHLTSLISSLGDVNTGALPDIMKVLSSSGKDLDGWVKNVLGRSDVDQAHKDAITHAQAEPSGPQRENDMRDALVRALNQFGNEKTDGEKLTANLNNFSNKLTELGTSMVKPINDLNGVISNKLLAPLDTIADALSIQYGKTFDGDGGTAPNPGEKPGAAAPGTVPDLGTHLPDWIVGTRGRRNHNPLNLNYAGQQGAIGKDGQFAVFHKDTDGIAANANQLLLNKQKDGGGPQTLGQIIRRWDTGDDQATVDAYIKSVSKDLSMGGLSPTDENTKMDVSNPTELQALIIAMSKVENKGWYPAGDDVREGVARALRQHYDRHNPTNDPAVDAQRKERERIEEMGRRQLHNDLGSLREQLLGKHDFVPLPLTGDLSPPAADQPPAPAPIADGPKAPPANDAPAPPPLADGPKAPPDGDIPIPDVLAEPQALSANDLAAPPSAGENVPSLPTAGNQKVNEPALPLPVAPPVPYMGKLPPGVEWRPLAPVKPVMAIAPSVNDLPDAPPIVGRHPGKLQKDSGQDEQAMRALRNGDFHFAEYAKHTRFLRLPSVNDRIPNKHPFSDYPVPGQHLQLKPLRVIHETAAGQHLREEHLPVTNVGAPSPWNRA